MRPALKHPIPLDLRQALRQLTAQHREVVELVCGLRPGGKRHTLREIAALPSQTGNSWQSVAKKRDHAFQRLWPLGYQAFQVLALRKNGSLHIVDFYQTGYDLVERRM